MEGNPWDLLESHRAALTAFLRGKCDTAADVEDCVQEALLRASLVKDLRPAGTWALLKTIAYRLAMDTHRRRHRQSRLAYRLGIPPPSFPDDLALDREEARTLAAAAEALSRRERLALLGKATGMSPRETASALGVPAPSIHRALSRARTALKAAAWVAGVLGWIRWRFARATARAASTTTSVVAAAGITLLLFAGSSPAWSGQGGRPPALVIAPSNVSSTPRAASPPRLSPAALPGPRSARPGATTVLQVGSPAPQAVKGGIGIKLTNQNESLLTSLEACAQPGAISLDPQHAGCNR